MSGTRQELHEFVEGVGRKGDEVAATHRLLKLSVESSSRGEILRFPHVIQILIANANGQGNSHELKWRSVLIISLLCFDRGNHANLLANPDVLSLLFSHAKWGGYTAYAMSALSVLFTAPGVWHRSDFISLLCQHCKACESAASPAGTAFWALRNAYLQQQQQRPVKRPNSHDMRLFWQSAQSVWTVLALKPQTPPLRRLPIELVKLLFCMLNG
ncbi:hypothetical protein BASA81_000681 [Batrachochytrium salamandrivorans]|nr:hypothetical protein BASA81_000681 [Batrachochytrium salamandrivorans]